MHPILEERSTLGLFLFGWLLLGLMLTFVVVGGGAEWSTAALVTLPLIAAYAIVCLAAWYPCRAHPLPESGALRAITVHLVGALLAAALLVALGTLWSRLLELVPSQAGTAGLFAANRPLFLAAGVLLYLLAVAIHYLLLVFDRSRRAEQRALELKVLAREAELAAFRTQIDPHFLFNSLNSISSLCGSDPAAARHATVRLGELLRATLDLGADEVIPLRRELELTAAYLDVETVRFGDRLRYTQQVPEDCLDARVPALLLQPLVENALKHGIAHRIDGGRIELRCERRDGSLRLELANDCDPARPASRGGGIGLANVRGRLDLLYGGAARLTAREGDDRFEVELRLPAGGGGGDG